MSSVNSELLVGDGRMIGVGGLAAAVRVASMTGVSLAF